MANQNKFHGETPTDFLIKLTKKHKKFLDENKKPYVAIISDEHTEVYRIESNEYKGILQKMFRESTGKYMRDKNIKEVIEIISNDAKVYGEQIPLKLRIAQNGEHLYYDLGDIEWQTIKISSKKWSIVHNQNIIFKRYQHQKAQCLPEGNGSVKELLEFINVSNKQKILFIVTIISYFIPNLAHPIMFVYGEKGSGKSSISKVLKELIDPSDIQVYAKPKNEKDMPQFLSKHWFAPFDNISKLSSSESDDLCCAITEASFVKRALYLDDDEVSYKIRNCILINCINIVAAKDDLIDRSVLINLKRIADEKRMTDEDYWKNFIKAKPRILGAIFDVIVKAIRMFPDIKPPILFRLADYTKWGFAIAQALGGLGDKFIEQYKQNVQQQNREIIDMNPVATTIVKFMEKKEKWEGSASHLLKSLEKIAFIEGISIRNEFWVKSPAALTRRLNSIESNLLQIGIIYIHHGHKNYGSHIQLIKKE